MRRQNQFTTNWPDVRREECANYHFIDLPNGEVFEGQWDLRGRMPEYIGGVDVNGKSVLDLGCASGFLSFEMERLGANNVVSFDADDHRRIAFIPVPGSPYVEDKESWKVDTDQFLTRLKNGYWYCHKRLNSGCVAYYGDVYDTGLPGQMFDIVVMGQILVHLRDPITAIMEAGRVCRDALIIAEGPYESNDAALSMHARAERGGPPYMWYALSLPAYREVLALAGFKIESVSTAEYNCTNHEHAVGDIAIQTIVARRL